MGTANSLGAVSPPSCVYLLLAIDLELTLWPVMHEDIGTICESVKPKPDLINERIKKCNEIKEDRTGISAFLIAKRKEGDLGGVQLHPFWETLSPSSFRVKTKEWNFLQRESIQWLKRHQSPTYDTELNPDYVVQRKEDKEKGRWRMRSKPLSLCCQIYHL